jgi:hypothetical protein
MSFSNFLVFLLPSLEIIDKITNPIIDCRCRAKDIIVGDKGSYNDRLVGPIVNTTECMDI